jgi:hypothetical protein
MHSCRWDAEDAEEDRIDEEARLAHEAELQRIRDEEAERLRLEEEERLRLEEEARQVTADLAPYYTRTMLLLFLNFDRI